MMPLRIYPRIIVYCLLVLCISAVLKAEPSDSVLTKIMRYKTLIKQTCYEFDVNPDILISIIYTERTLNFNWQDKLFDVAGARAGYNTSVGLAQVKVSTAMWIELQYNDSTASFFPSVKYRYKIPFSRNRAEVIDKLIAVETNLRYAAAYLRLFIDFWRQRHLYIDENGAILGTLYSRGPYEKTGRIIEPSVKMKINKFGLLVEKNILIINRAYNKKMKR